MFDKFKKEEGEEMVEERRGDNKSPLYSNGQN